MNNDLSIGGPFFARRVGVPITLLSLVLVAGFFASHGPAEAQDPPVADGRLVVFEIFNVDS